MKEERGEEEERWGWAGVGGAGTVSSDNSNSRRRMSCGTAPLSTDINRRWIFFLHSVLLKDEIPETPQTSLQEQCGEFVTPRKTLPCRAVAILRVLGGTVATTGYLHFCLFVFVCVLERKRERERK